MESLRVSVIITVYNLENYLDQCIESIAAQSYSNLEIILVDDGSKDRCPQICDRWAEKDSRILVIHKKNGGVVSARIAGCEVASGAYISYVDADDYVGADFIKNLVNQAVLNEVDMVLDGYHSDEDGKIGPSRSNRLPCGYYDYDAVQNRIRPHILDNGIFPYGCVKLFKGTLLKNYQKKVPLGIQNGEDQLIVLMCLNASHSIVVSEFCDYYYRQIGSSNSRKYNERYVQQLDILFKYLWEELVQTDCPGREAQFAAYVLNSFFIGVCNIVQSSNVKNNFGKLYQSFLLLARQPQIAEACCNREKYGITHPFTAITRMWVAVGRGHYRQAYLDLWMYKVRLICDKFRKR